MEIEIAACILQTSILFDHLPTLLNSPEARNF